MKRGRKFDFHGKFETKRAARIKERELGDGAFIIKVKGHYYVVSRKDEE